MIIGLTGGMGSGKSTVAAGFATKGIPIIDADQIAKTLVMPGTPALHDIVEHFGRTLLDPKGQLDRARLRDHIFSHPEARIWLETRLHPDIFANISEQLALPSTAPYRILMIPLLLETHAALRLGLDRILVVDCSPDLQITRIQTRDHLTVAQITAILNTQCSRETRLATADDVITNEGNIKDLQQQIECLHTQYLRLTA